MNNLIKLKVDKNFGCQLNCVYLQRNLNIMNFK